eukprot:TRINITY_DN2532_c0_g1_i1.p1 TRINITY_DN2532_c0_g1~~TRINITY_DN2532_c0_g1_i1.p1  ORF type:complete len:424 (-),score=97.22 TRINITY_DN2532_c0_g1_i1:1196-2467(-)
MLSFLKKKPKHVSNREFVIESTQQERFVVSIPESGKGKDLKDAIEKQSGHISAAQKLIFDGELFSDESKLTNIPNLATIKLFVDITLIDSIKSKSAASSGEASEVATVVPTEDNSHPCSCPAIVVPPTTEEPPTVPGEVEASAPCMPIDGGVEECPICFEAFTDKDPITPIKCGHMFHEMCLTEWMTQSEHCPMCRRIILKMDDPSSLEDWEVVDKAEGSPSEENKKKKKSNSVDDMKKMLNKTRERIWKSDGFKKFVKHSKNGLKIAGSVLWSFTQGVVEEIGKEEKRKRESRHQTMGAPPLASSMNQGPMARGHGHSSSRRHKHNQGIGLGLGGSILTGMMKAMMVGGETRKGGPTGERARDAGEQEVVACTGCARSWKHSTRRFAQCPHCGNAPPQLFRCACGILFAPVPNRPAQCPNCG